MREKVKPVIDKYARAGRRGPGEGVLRGAREGARAEVLSAGAPRHPDAAPRRSRDRPPRGRCLTRGAPGKAVPALRFGSAGIDAVAPIGATAAPPPKVDGPFTAEP